MGIIQREPVRFWAAVTTLVQAVIALLIVFEVVTWTDIQIATLMGVVAAIGGLIQFFLVQSQVTPVSKQ